MVFIYHHFYNECQTGKYRFLRNTNIYFAKYFPFLSKYHESIFLHFYKMHLYMMYALEYFSEPFLSRKYLIPLALISQACIFQKAVSLSRFLLKNEIESVFNEPFASTLYEIKISL